LYDIIKEKDSQHKLLTSKASSLSNYVSSDEKLVKDEDEKNWKLKDKEKFLVSIKDYNTIKYDTVRKNVVQVVLNMFGYTFDISVDNLKENNDYDIIMRFLKYQTRACMEQSIKYIKSSVRHIRSNYRSR
jgi:hypothetical protein